MKKLVLSNILILSSFISMAQIRIVVVSEVKVENSTIKDYCIVFSRDSQSKVDTISDTADKYEPGMTYFEVYPLYFHNYQKALDFKIKNLHNYNDCINYNHKIFLRNERIIKQRDAEIATPLNNNTPNSTAAINKSKLKLTQYILSCESIYYSILQSSDIEERDHLADIGTRYYNQAYQAWISLQSAKAGITPELNKSIPTILMMFEKLFREKESLQNPTAPLAMEFLNGELIRNILPKMWGTK